ncbi:oxidoreductase [Halarchaeum acidiphilum MH1-52-1]|uniref:Oxidoreductase n=1 Tax=Halarchaeum acidiphilum MH1-52-1 TaxID=1261545 RepID=U2YEN2_9EURY|nr:oxidoreductase [Halarchaeum acidiphilum MH1-52-1]
MRLTGGDVIGRPPSEPNARDVRRRADELGVDFIDTADSYGPAVSERLIGETREAVETVAERHDATVYQVSLA